MLQVPVNLKILQCGKSFTFMQIHRDTFRTRVRAAKIPATRHEAGGLGQTLFVDLDVMTEHFTNFLDLLQLSTLYMT